jgi:hypothetical protein
MSDSLSPVRGPEPRRDGHPPEVPAGGATDPDRTLKSWVPPEVGELPPLNDLTLQTGDPIGGGEGVFG